MLINTQISKMPTIRRYMVYKALPIIGPRDATNHP